jgi:hypothetical protein
MVWNRKKAAARRFPAKESYDLVLSSAEKAGQRTVTAAWPTGLSGPWLKSAPDAIILPAKRRPKAPKPCGCGQ